MKVPEISEEKNQEEFKPYKRPRRDYTIEQKEVLEKEFETKKYLDLDEMNALAKQLDLEYDQVKNWFSGRRSKWNSEIDDPSKQIRRRKPNKKQKGSHNRYVNLLVQNFTARWHSPKLQLSDHSSAPFIRYYSRDKKDTYP